MPTLPTNGARERATRVRVRWRKRDNMNNLKNRGDDLRRAAGGRGRRHQAHSRPGDPGPPHILAVVLVALDLWIFRDSGLAYFAGGAVLLGGLAFGLPLVTVTAGFTSSALWVLIPALFFGFALAKTGLGKRIAFLMLKSFKPSYPSIILSWCLIGLILSAMTPSITVRIAIVMPIATNLVEAYKLPDARARRR